MKTKIHCLGPTGTYAHEVASRLMEGFSEPLPVHDSNYETLESVDAESIGVVPVENSTEGLVVDTKRFWLDVLGQAPRERRAPRVIGEYILPVRHCLVGIAGATPTRVMSHAQPIGQCSRFIRERRLATDVALSTALAARTVATRQDPYVGAICSRFAAATYGLTVLESDIQNSADNETRFHVVAYDRVSPTGDDRTALICELPNRPKALAEALLILGDRGINVSCEQSLNLGPERYAHYLEAECHEDDARGREAIALLRTLAGDRLHVLGSYPRYRRNAEGVVAHPVTAELLARRVSGAWRPMKVLVVGGRGHCGTWVGRVCREVLGDEVSVCDLDNAGDLPALAAEADVAILSVSLPEAPAVAARLAASMPAESLIVDLSSVKLPVFRVLNAARPYFALVHFMCKPQADVLSIGAEPLVIAHERLPAVGPPLEWYGWFLRAIGGTIVRSSVSEHDRVAKVLQSTVHASLVGLAEQLEASGVPFARARQMAAPVARPVLGAMERFLGHGSADVFAWLQEAAAEDGTLSPVDGMGRAVTTLSKGNLIDARCRWSAARRYVTKPAAP